VRGRYGIDDKVGKGTLQLSRVTASGMAYDVFATRDFRDLSDVAERSGVVNSLAAQEFASDYTDPYLTRAIGASATFPTYRSLDIRLEGTYELDDPLSIHADPVRGTFRPTTNFEQTRATRLSLTANRPMSPWIGNTDLSLRGELRSRVTIDSGDASQMLRQSALRGSLLAGLETPIGSRMRLVTSGMLAGVHASSTAPMPILDFVYLGGPVSAPGYDYHSSVGSLGYYAHVELHVPAPFPAFSLGRYGRVPGQATLAPFFHVAGARNGIGRCATFDGGVGSGCVLPNDFMPAFGAGYLTPFDLVRIDVAKGVGRNGRWTFAIDVTRDFWSIL